ncbi:MAG: hypothetical protein EBR82_22535 [Caulobacteraceae bacterium]|nr:hypothetical protein [Caulobacteraceae bacterium]
MIFEVDKYYTGKCDEVRVVQLGDAMAMEFGFVTADDEAPTKEFRGYTKVFLGSDKVGKDKLTNDERIKRDLKEFGCTDEGLDTGNVMAHIRGVVIGKEIEVQAGEYKGEIQFSGCRMPGSRPGPTVVMTENPFGRKKATPKSGNIF